MITAQAPPRGYSATREQLLVRLARIEGQVRGVARMVQEDRPCVDVLTQIAAIQAALDKVSLGLLDGHVRTCLTANRDDGDVAGAEADELMRAVGRMLGS